MPSERPPHSASPLDEDPRLGRHVVRTRVGGEERLFHSVSRALLPVDASEQELADGLFLAGQEDEALEGALFRERPTLCLTTILTWTCNLRCNHCSVLGRLVPADPQRLEPAALVDFVRRFAAHFPSTRTLKLSLIGGEPLLASGLGLRLVDAARALVPEPLEELRSDLTTNLAVPLGEGELALLRAVDDIIVSVDGLEEAHNHQRRTYGGAKFNPWRRTMDGLERLVAEGLGDRVLVQGAIRDEFATIEHFQGFQRAMMRAGVRWDRVKFDTIHPTEHRKRPEETYLAALRRAPFREQPCCKYRGARNLVVGTAGELYSDYYDWERLGELADPIERIEEAHNAMMRARMPVLVDEACRTCPVVAYCWGGCSNAHRLVGSRPSEYCDRENLRARVLEAAREGRLVGERARRNEAACGSQAP